MRALVCVLLAAVGTLATDTDYEARASKRPYVADAVGNTLPPPSNLPATVGSPVNLISPDRYEFYTFDESGELVKRLMTLEEIQGIVAAGEEAEGLVTFANDNQPTIAFNFSQPPYTKVHNVVTNVQNVLKAQMEAHKNKPHFQPTLDTPDVSDSWSLILPSIFGNTGVDIVPDKIQNPGTFTTPETETIILDQQNPDVDDIVISKEGDNQVISSSTTLLDEEVKAVPVTEKLPTIVKEVETDVTTSTITTTTTTTTTPKPKTTSTTRKPIVTTTTARPTRRSTTTTSTTSRPHTSTSSVTKSKPTVATMESSTTGIKLSTTTTTTVQPEFTPTITTVNLSPIITSTSTVKPTANIAESTTTTYKSTTTPKTVRITPKTTIKPTTITNNLEDSFLSNKIQIVSSNTEKSSVQNDKMSTFIPVSTVTYITERATQALADTTEKEEIIASTTKRATISTTKLLSTSTTPIPSSVSSSQTTKSNFIYLSSTAKPIQEHENDKTNVTTITTQSISPSTTESSNEFSSGENNLPNHIINEEQPSENTNDNVPIPIFDVAQSISQIASDLNGNFVPIPTSSNLLDTTKISDIELESKENSEMDISTDSPTDPDTHVTGSNGDNFVKISTLDPHASIGDRITKPEESLSDQIKSKNVTTEKVDVTTVLFESTTIDPFLSGSMDDLLSQVVNEQTQTVVTEEKQSTDDMKITTTEIKLETTTTEIPDLTTLSSSTIPFEVTNEAPVKSENTSNFVIENRITETKVPSDNTAQQNKPEGVSSTIKNTEKIENYVQISVSHDKVESTSATPITVPSSTKTTQSHNNTSVTLQNAEKVENEIELTSVKNDAKSTTEITKIQITTKSPISSELLKNSTSSQLVVNNNKYSSDNTNNKLNKKNEKNKVPELLPKIDDFKKKIQKVNIDDKELSTERNNSWKLVSTVSPPKTNEIPKDKTKNGGHSPSNNNANKDINLDVSKENQGLEVTTKNLGEDIAQFTELCNELAFRYWNAVIANIDIRRSFVLSPYSITSMLAMMFMGARGATSGEMNEVLKLDDMVTFNPHFTLKNISDSIETSPEAGVIVSAFIRELYSDKSKGKILRFYKERAQQFYNGHVEEIDFKMIGDKIRRRTNLLVKRYTWGKISEYVKTDTIQMQPPLAAFSANIFETDCSGSSVEGRDGEMYFVVSPNVRQRRLVPVPAVVYRSGFLAGYDPVLDATAAALGNVHSIVSTLFLMPGQQGNVVHSEDLEALERRLLDSNPSTPTWNRLLRTLLPRIGLELQIPRFSHKSVFNVSSTLRKMGLKDLFDSEHADLGGLNGPSKDLYLSDMIQATTFVTCGEGIVGDQHHVESYPETVGLRRRTSRWATDWDEPRDYQRAFHDPHDVGEAMHLPLHLRPRQARLPARNAQPARLRFDRPFLYFVRHNPSGMILYFGRYNPRLLP